MRVRVIPRGHEWFRKAGIRRFAISSLSTIRRNEQTIIGDFDSYLEGLRREKAYGPYASNLGEGITTHFTKLIETFPNANYKGMLPTAKAIEGKVETPEIKKALSELIGKLESIQSKDADPV